MSEYRTGVVVAELSRRRGLQRLLVRIEGIDQRAYNLTQLTGDVDVGDEVVCNTTAVGLGLGTGGWHVVHWNLARRSLSIAGGGHIMKLRYTSLQADTGTAEEHEPPEPSGPVDGDGGGRVGGSLAGVPVVVCSLHSQMGVVAAAFASAAPGMRLAYVMTDGAALPLAISELVHDLRTRGLLAGTVTAGNAFGGDREAVTTLSALSVAVRAFAADAVVVAMGPGVVGTASALGTTAIEVAPIVDGVRALGGEPIVAVRASSADQRPRHFGLSHHSATALRLCRGATLAAAEADLADGGALRGLRTFGQHRVAGVAVDDADVVRLLDALHVRVTTMGRAPAADPLFFRTAAAAGLLAARRLSRP